MAQWSHTASWPDNPRSDPETDRKVLFCGEYAGRVRLVKTGWKEPYWTWAGSWIGPHHYGQADTFEDALEALRTEFYHVLRTEPKRMLVNGFGDHYRQPEQFQEKVRQVLAERDG